MRDPSAFAADFAGAEPENDVAQHQTWIVFREIGAGFEALDPVELVDVGSFGTRQVMADGSGGNQDAEGTVERSRQFHRGSHVRMRGQELDYLFIGDLGRSAGPGGIGGGGVEMVHTQGRCEISRVLFALEAQYISCTALAAGIEHRESARFDTMRNLHAHGATAFHHRGQTMLPIDQCTIGIEGYALVGMQPLTTPHRFCQLGNHHPAHRAIAGVPFQPFRGQMRCDVDGFGMESGDCHVWSYLPQ